MTAPRVPPPTTPHAVPGWSNVFDEWNGLEVGDAVLVDGHTSARILSIASNRRSGGVYVIVRLDDGTKVGRRPGDLLRVIEPAAGEQAP